MKFKNKIIRINLFIKIFFFNVLFYNHFTIYLSGVFYLTNGHVSPMVDQDKAVFVLGGLGLGLSPSARATISRF